MVTNLISKSQLKEQRQWTDSLIKRFLPEPDQVKRNPLYRKAPPMQLFRLERVIAIEESTDFQSGKAATDKRRTAGLVTADRKRKDTLDGVASLPAPILPKLEPEKLTGRAIRHYNQLWEDRGRYEKNAKPTDDPAFLQRITVNYVRHMLTDYEHHLNALFRQVGKRDAIALVRQKVLQAIADAYPWLAGEANRQME